MTRLDAAGIPATFTLVRTSVLALCVAACGRAGKRAVAQLVGFTVAFGCPGDSMSGDAPDGMDIGPGPE